MIRSGAAFQRDTDLALLPLSSNEQTREPRPASPFLADGKNGSSVITFEESRGGKIAFPERTQIYVEWDELDFYLANIESMNDETDKCRHYEMIIGNVVGRAEASEVRLVSKTKTSRKAHDESSLAGSFVLKSFDTMVDVKREMMQIEGRFPRAPNVVQTCFVGLNQTRVFTLMEFMDLGDSEFLVHYHGPFPRNVISGLLIQVSAGLQVFHTCGLIHDNLKPSNILLKRDGVVKISDSASLKPILNDSETFQDSYFASPERVNSDRHGISSDIWSLGVLGAYFALGVCPLISSTDLAERNHLDIMDSHFPNIFAIQRRLEEGSASVDFDLLEGLVSAAIGRPLLIAQPLKEFVCECMKPIASERPSSATLQQHQFFENYPMNKSDLKNWFVGIGFASAVQARY